ncbi:hypothetical protein U729_3218 (plasmid) [Clostridium baratii str. Sullivan]|uniref:Uncharacterized protein n=1 Tax=Clostridium baratii str. Sullivan TaxID=1415775 RepID=A0A0A7G0C4_9CLOT|nr:hypothetical protein [Clostridium baratii]AIY85304.1 hypothetical protein U729_3218 [Clostridium baratii str. Sullivan]
MPKYRIPMQIISYTEIEADNLENAISNVCSGLPDVEGVNLSYVDSWEVSQYDSIFIDGEELYNKEMDEGIYLSDIKNKNLHKY